MAAAQLNSLNFDSSDPNKSALELNEQKLKAAMELKNKFKHQVASGCNTPVHSQTPKGGRTPASPMDDSDDDMMSGQTPGLISIREEDKEEEVFEKNEEKNAVKSEIRTVDQRVGQSEIKTEIKTDKMNSGRKSVETVQSAQISMPSPVKSAQFQQVTSDSTNFETKPSENSQPAYQAPINQTSMNQTLINQTPMNQRVTNQTPIKPTTIQTTPVPIAPPKPAPNLSILGLDMSDSSSDDDNEVVVKPIDAESNLSSQPTEAEITDNLQKSLKSEPKRPPKAEEDSFKLGSTDAQWGNLEKNDN